MHCLVLLLSQICTSQWFHQGSNSCLFTHIQVSQEMGKLIWYFHLFKNFVQFFVIHRIKGLSIVNEADVFLEFSCFLYDPVNVGNLISGSSVFFKTQLVHLEVFSSYTAETSLKDFEHNLTCRWNKYSNLVVWALLSTSLLWNWT